MMSLSPRVVAGLCALGAGAAALAGPSVEVEAVWVEQEINLGECGGLSEHTSVDLYLAFDSHPGNTIAVTSDDKTGLTIMGGAFHHDETGANGPRPDGWYKVFPCAEWDSYLTIGGTTPFFTPEYPPLDEMDWGTVIAAEWLPNPGDPIEVEMDALKFGDSRFYVQIARLTGTPGTTSIAGTLGVVFFPFPGAPSMPVEATVEVMNCAPCWGSADLDGSGIVGSGDLAVVLASWGPCAGCVADFNGDGVVDSEDLAYLLAFWEK